jgi:hypothetical protein
MKPFVLLLALLLPVAAAAEPKVVAEGAVLKVDLSHQWATGSKEAWSRTVVATLSSGVQWSTCPNGTAADASTNGPSGNGVLALLSMAAIKGLPVQLISNGGHPAGFPPECFDEIRVCFTGTCAAVCGDGACEADESCGNCPGDCAAATKWYADLDDDGYGDPESVLTGCEQPPGHIAMGRDCDDDNLHIHPLAGDKIADGVDGDCDGLDCEAKAYSGAYFAVCPAPTSSWSDANEICKNAGYDGLASIHDVFENTMVFELAKAAGQKVYMSDNGWLALTNVGGAWQWADGTALNYLNWGSSEPNGGANQCGHMLDWSSNGKWNDTACTYGKPFTCGAR